MLAAAVMRCVMKLSSAWLSNVSGQILTCEEVDNDMIATIDDKSAAWLVMPRSSADELWPLLLSCSPRSTITPGVNVEYF